MKAMKSERLFGTALLGLGLLGAALAHGVLGQQNDGARVQNSSVRTTQSEMSAKSPVSLWVQGEVGRAPNPNYPITSSGWTRLASSPKSAATLPARYWRRSGVLERFAFPGYHSIDYGCKGVGVVFSVHAPRGWIRGEGWPGLPQLCARLERK